MSIIYTPKGKAREYSPLAANFYNGCDHGCLYCYAPAIKRMTAEQYKEVSPRRDLIHQLERDCKKFHRSETQVLFNFMGDPYCKANEEHGLTSKALELFLEHKIPVVILTKGGERAFKDIGIIQQFGDNIKIGFTLTFNDEAKSQEWENGAASPQERIETMRKFKGRGVKTWASFEPVIDPKESLAIMRKSISVTDEYKVGKLNNYRGIDKGINWTDFLENVVKILREAKKPFYIKHDLRQVAPSVKLYGNEVLQDEFVIKNTFK